MPREKDSFRNYVEFLQNNKWKCNSCNKEYAGSVTRIKAHLAGVGGYGINNCKDVNDRVRSEARKALKGKGAAESSNGAEGNVEEGSHLPVTANDEDACRETSFAAMPYLSCDVISTVGAGSSAFLPLPETNLPSQSLLAQSMIPLRGSLGPQQPQSHAGDSYTQPWNFSYPISHPDIAPEALTNMPHPQYAEEGEPNTEVVRDARTDDALVDSRSGIFGLVGEYLSTLKRKLEELSNRVPDLDDQWCRKSKIIKDRSIVRAFQEGKSFFAQEVKRVDDLSKEVEEILGHCSFQKGLMTHAAGCRKSSPLVTTKLVGERGEETIEEICDYLMEEEIVIIGIYGMGGVGKTAILMHVHNRVLENPAFDDVFWVTVPKKFSVYKLQDEIANAVGLDNLSRNRDVKRRASMLNRHLKKKRAILILDGLWMHFNFEDVGIPIEKGGIKLILTTQSLDVCHKMLCQKQIKIVPLESLDDWRLFREKLCFGRELPLDIEKFAQSIVNKCGGLPLGIIEIATHMRGVEEVHKWKGMFRKLYESSVELNAFKRLKLSYVNLDDSQVQRCFLHLAQAYEFCFDLPLDKAELVESFIDEGLLDRIGTRQELHEQGNTILDKLRKVCLCDDVEEVIYLHPLVRDMALHILRSPAHMVKIRKGLEEIPEEKFWTDRLEKVFLQSNKIEGIQNDLSPNCPKLSRLSLSCNFLLEAIHESFFMHLKGLKVLDLSHTALTKLPDAISHLVSLEALLLQRCCQLRHIPCVGKLGSLRKLDMSHCVNLEEVPKGMDMLVKLSYLDLFDTRIKMLSEEMLGKLVNLQYLAINKEMAWLGIELKKVEVLYCFVSNVETFNAWVRILEQNSSRSYDLRLNDTRHDHFRDMHKRCILIESCHGIAVRVDGEICGDGRALLPKNVQVLKVGQCDELTSLCDIGPLDNLEELEIKEWEKLEEMGAVHFPHLRTLNISMCSKLKHLLEEGQGQVLPCLQCFEIEDLEELEGINIAAQFLYNIEVDNCPKMKRVVEWEWLATHLPNLRSFIIRSCEKLEEIIGGPISTTCHLTNIEIEGCNNLKRVLTMQGMLGHLPFLRYLSVKDCEGIEVIVGTVFNMTQSFFLNLTHLTLSNLPELKSICDGTVSCLSIESIHITNCPKLKRLPLLDDGLPCPPRSLDSIWIDLLTWQSLEWDYSIFPHSLKHLARYHEEVSNLDDQRVRICIQSCDNIATKVDGEIDGDGHNLLPKDMQVLTIGRGSAVTSLSEISPPENLEELKILGWEKLEELGAVHFPHLQGLEIAWCSKLTHLPVEGQGLPCLQWFKIKDSKELEGIDLAAPSLNYMEVFSCPKMKRVVEWDWLATRLPNLKSITICGCEKLEKIIGGPLPTGATCFLTKIEIENCNKMKGVLLTHDMLLHLPFLQQIAVKCCDDIGVIIGTALQMTRTSFPKLTNLTLCCLPELTRICDRMESCDHIQYIEILDCPKLKRIPLRLHPLDNGLLSPPISLGQILIDPFTWEKLKQKDSLACISLEPLVKIYG